MPEATPPDAAAAAAAAQPAAAAANAGTDAGGSSTPAKAADGAQPAAAVAPAKPADAATAFKIPDAYKDKPWAAKVKSEDDLYKQIDTLDALKGKKQVVPDFTKATPAELEQYYAQTRPENADAYQFNADTDPEIKKGLSEAMFKNGISSFQANEVIKTYQALEANTMEGMFSADGMNAELQKAFGDDWKEVGGVTAKILKKNLSADDAAMMDKLPNPFLGLVYRMANNLIKGYGITESGAHVDAGSGKAVATDVEAVRTGLRTQIAGLQSNPHTADDKQALIDQLNATYVTKAKA